MLTKPAFLLFISTLAIAVIYAVAFVHPLGVFELSVLAIAISLATTSIMAFGLPRNSRRGRILMLLSLVFTFAVVCVGFLIAIHAHTPRPADRLLGGLPLGAAAVIYIVAFVPLIALPLVYAFTFDDKRK